ncbi:MAG: kinase/pyrophosphorylase [Gammaproteobacteria bacterium]|jgi:[pyruvate, water dikinase]-phosphate phosphotransferase / [pyruvate, water dikinase] kinase
MTKPLLVYFISESTAITAQTLGNSLLSQFEDVEFERHYMPYINTIEKAQELADELRDVTAWNGDKPIVFATMPDKEIDAMLRSASCHYYELFSGYLKQLSDAIGITPSYRFGLSHGIANARSYDKRMDIVNYSLTHDDGMILNDLDEADIILVGVSRSGKTPTSLYLALQFGVKTANYPLTEEDFERGRFPDVLLGNADKLVGITIDPLRLQEIREKRRPGSKYASLQTCQQEVRQAERFFSRYGTPVLDSTTRSIEELASQIVRVHHVQHPVKPPRANHE